MFLSLLPSSGAHAFRNNCSDSTCQITSSKGEVRRNPIDLPIVAVWVCIKEQHFLKGFSMPAFIQKSLIKT